MFIVKNEKKYARVSAVLTDLNKFDHIDPDMLERKRQIGVDVHAAINQDLNGAFPVLRSETRAYFESYMIWKEKLNPFVVQSEARYFDEDYSITGQIDLLIRLPNCDDLVLVDFKTSSQVNATVWPLQAHLYAYLLNKNGLQIAKKYLFVKLSQKAAVPLVVVYEHDDAILVKSLALCDKFWLEEKKIPF